jgi:hypothetical protein
MMRIVIENVLLFLLPTLVYLAYAVVTRERATNDPATGVSTQQPGLLDDAPLLYLFAAGVFLVIATLVMFGSNSGGKPDQAYHPPVIKDGRVEPGRIE